MECQEPGGRRDGEESVYVGVQSIPVLEEIRLDLFENPSRRGLAASKINSGMLKCVF